MSLITIYSNVIDSFGNPFVNARVNFTPIDAPFFSGISTSTSNAKYGYTDSDGNLTSSLVSGQYHVIISSQNYHSSSNHYRPPQTSFDISVPASGSSYNINQLQVINPSDYPTTVLFLPISSSDARYLNINGTASWATNAVNSAPSLSASYSSYALTSSYSLNGGSGGIISSSWASQSLSSSYLTGRQSIINSDNNTIYSDGSGNLSASSVTGAFVGNLTGTSSWAKNTLTSSYVSSSKILTDTIRVGNGLQVYSGVTSLAGGLAVSGLNDGIGTSLDNADITTDGNGNMTIGGYLSVTNPITGSLNGTASWAKNATSASWAPSNGGGSGTTLTSGSTYNITSSWANNSVTSSYITTAQTASYVATSSWSNNSVATISASWASASLSSSTTTNSLTSSYVATSSWSNNSVASISASWASSSLSSSFANLSLSSSYYSYTMNSSTYLGQGAGGGNSQGGTNVTAIGNSAGYNCPNNNGSTYVGENAGLSAGNSTNATFIGASATVLAGVTASKSIAIGYSAQVSGSNMCAIGGTGANAVNVIIGGTSPVNTLDVVGNISCSVITASLFNGTASWSQTASYVVNGGSAGGTTLTSGSTYNITSSWSVSSSYAINTSPTTTLYTNTTSSTNWITCSFNNPYQWLNLTTTASYSFTASNFASSNYVSSLILYISSSYPSGQTSSLSFPSSWIFIGSGAWPTQIPSGSSVLWLSNFGIANNNIIGTFNSSSK